MSETPLIVAVPSKGRLQENASAFFARAGLPLTQARGGRDYRGGLGGLPDVEVAYLSAGEIATQLATGAVHLGITGEDLLRETVRDADIRLELLTPLGFGFANVVVAVPQSWIDVRTMADLGEVADAMRARHGRRFLLATKYARLTRAFFARHGVVDYRIVESLGATEAAPQAGTADAIVDITTSGATLAANGLKVLDDGVILRSEANLVASLAADWNPRVRAVARTVLGRMAAEETARTTREVRAGFPGACPDVGTLATRFGARRPAGGREDGPELVLHCPSGQVFALVDELVAAGAAEVSVRALDYVFRPDVPLLDRLIARLPAA